MKKSTAAIVLMTLFTAGQLALAAEPAKPEVAVNLDLAGLDLNAAVESLSVQSGAVFVVAVHSRKHGPDLQLTAIPLTEAINTVAVAYGVCAEAQPPITSFRDCGASHPPRRSTRGVALLGAEIYSGALTSPGVLVVQVLPDSVAAGAQLQPGDIIAPAATQTPPSVATSNSPT